MTSVVAHGQVAGRLSAQFPHLRYLNVDDFTDANNERYFSPAAWAHSGQSRALSASDRESVLYGAFAWASRVLNSQKRRCPARAVNAADGRGAAPERPARADAVLGQPRLRRCA